MAVVGNRRFFQLDGALRSYFLFDFVELQVFFIGFVEQLQKDLFVGDDLTVYWGLFNIGAFQFLALGDTIEQPVEYVVVVDLVLALQFMQLLPKEVVIRLLVEAETGYVVPHILQLLRDTVEQFLCYIDRTAFGRLRRMLRIRLPRSMGFSSMRLSQGRSPFNQ